MKAKTITRGQEMKHALTASEVEAISGKVDKKGRFHRDNSKWISLSIIDNIQADAEQEFKLEAIKWKSIGESFDLNDTLSFSERMSELKLIIATCKKFKGVKE